MTFIAYYLHWPLDAIAELEHGDRRAWVEQISRLNQRINAESAELPA